MSRPIRKVPAYRHYKPRNLGVVRIDGRDHYLGRYGSVESREKYRRLLAEWLSGAPSNLAPGYARPEEGPTISELLLGYLRHADDYYRKNGRPTREPVNIRHALRPLRQLYGLTPARDFGPRSLKAVRKAMIDAGLCRGVVNQRVRQVVRFFKWAAENELVPPSVHHGLKAVSGLRKGRSEARESEPIRPVPDDQVDAIRPHVARQVWAMVQLQRLTGMRPGEVVTMRTSDLDRAGDVWAYRPAEHKAEHHGRERTAFLGPKAQEVLRPWLREDPSAYLFSPKEAMEEFHADRRRLRKSPMTPSQAARQRRRRPRKAPGERYTVDSYRRAIAYACSLARPHPTLSAIPRARLTADQRAELKAWEKAHRWHPHRLRHAAATAIRARFGLEAAQHVLGHAAADVTELYAERDLATARRIMGEIG